MFDSLKDYYDLINNDLSFKTDRSLTNKLTHLRDKLDDENDKKRVDYEIYFNNFRFDKGVYIPLFGCENGICYPKITLFDDFDYIRQRANSSELLNLKFKAKYNHLLWESSIKHIDFAKSAINNYLKYLKIGELLPNDNLSNNGFSELFINLFVLCQNVNYKIKDTFDFILKYLDCKDLSEFHKCFLMSFICQNGRKVSRDYLQVFFDYSLEIIENQKTKEIEKPFLHLLIILSKKLSKPSKDYHNMLGDICLTESIKHEGSFAVHVFYIDAFKQYQLAGNKVKMEDLTVLIEKAKNSFNLKPISHNESAYLFQEKNDLIDKIISNLIVNGKSDDVYNYLMHSNDIFPEVKRLVTDFETCDLKLFRIVNFDINRNVKSTSPINNFSLYVKYVSMIYLKLVFDKGMINGVISFETLKNYLINNSWYSLEFEDVDQSGNTYNWLDLLLPALSNYFQQTEIDAKTIQNNNEGLILSIDSMTLKFEGVLREFSRAIGAQTIDIKDDGTHERISFEKLLGNDKFKALVPEDDIALFKYLFTSEGLNLRNNIAHCFYKAKNYSEPIMWLLICAFLKMGNSKLLIKNE